MGSVCIHLIFSVWNIIITMKEFCSFLCLLLVLPGSLSECNFRDETLFDGSFDMDQPTTSTGNDYGAFRMHRKLYVWPKHRVSYTFDRSMSSIDKNKAYQLLKAVRNGYRKKTCVRFQYYSRWIPKHHLLIKAKFNRGGCSWSGSVKTGHNRYKPQEMLMTLSLPQEIDWCRDNVEGHLFHEMGHAMGIMHTHKRRDRDDYIIYDENCADPNKKDQLEMIKKYHRTEQLKYECNSIMHYKRNTFNRHGCSERDWWCPCNVLTPRPRTSCKEIKPSLTPTKLDWDLINIGQNCPR